MVASHVSLELLIHIVRSFQIPCAIVQLVVDLSGVTITSGFRVDMLKMIYNVFEPNYPETLNKMVMYPVSNVLAKTARTLLNFVNETTQRKFVITSSLQVVCEELNWDIHEVEACGGVTEFMHKHETAGNDLILE